VVALPAEAAVGVTGLTESDGLLLAAGGAAVAVVLALVVRGKGVIEMLGC